MSMGLLDFLKTKVYIVFEYDILFGKIIDIIIFL